MTDNLKPIGIFGGTFDPIHFGHLRLAQDLLDILALDHIRFIPTGTPPHRHSPCAGVQHRLEMVKLATAVNHRFVVDDREVRRHKLCYTFDTLSELKNEFGTNRTLCLLMGADAFGTLSAWHRWRELFGLTHIVVASRPGFSMDDWELSIPIELKTEVLQRLSRDASMITKRANGTIISQEITPMGISASSIRQHFLKGQSARYLLPDTILDYIQSNQLYRDSNAN